jgi:adenylate cyclase
MDASAAPADHRLTMVIEREDGATLARRLERRIWTHGVLGNLLGAGVAAVNVALWAPVFLDGRRPSGMVALYAVALGTMLAAIPIGRLQVHRSFAPIRRWLTENRPATADERRAVLRMPARAAIHGLGWWAIVGVIAGLLDSYTPALLHGSLPLFKAECGVAASAGIASALSYLLVERVVRPLYGVLLSSDRSRSPVRMGITTRLVIMWAMVSAAPLLGIAWVFFGLSGSQRVLATDVAIVSCVLAVPAGFVVLYAAARSIADPLRVVRIALDRVEVGDLDVELPVDDTGEVGLVQSGFNRMVKGLRERRRLHEVFGRHVGTEIVDVALRDGGRLGGERRDASVLFIDIAGSTQITRRTGADEVVALLNDLFAAVVRCVRAQSGWVNKFTGDGAMCVFGPPGELDDHPARALHAARCLQAEVAMLQSKYDFEVGIGVSSGEVVAGNVGSEDRYEYTVLGDAVNEAARLTDQAKGHDAHVLASAASIERAGAERDNWTSTGTLELRGRPGPTEAFEPHAAATVAAR